jgi:hydroxymethylglutaryl-CoA reductase
MLVTRGKRVVAEATIRKDVLKNLMRGNVPADVELRGAALLALSR